MIQRTLVICSAGLLSMTAHAESLVPSPSVPNIAFDDGWAFTVGAALEYESEYDGSDDYGVEFEPAIGLQYRSGNQAWFLEGQELGWRARARDQWLLQAGLRFEGGREESESDALTGLGDTDDELMAMVEIRRGFGANWDNWVAGRVMAGGSDIGALGVLAAGHTFGANPRGTGIDVFAFTTFGSSAFINRDFGVNEDQSAGSGLPVTDIDGGYRSIGIGVIGRWELGNRWQFIGEAGYEKYSDDIADSPIALDDYEAEVGFSALYVF
ncbi:MAG: MipA/OmpV family protein [Woeseiaceae bacterium]|nr:MipA/OmpV family protein [Woeseiaceae bacterium]